MKKRLILSSALLAITAAQVEAQTISLRVDGTTLNGVVVDSFNLNNGTLSLVTSGADLAITVGGGVLEPEPEPEPEPDPEPEPEPDPGPQIGACVDDANIVCGNDFTDNSMLSGIRNESLTIPKGKTLVSTFKAPSSATYSAMVSFQAITGDATRLWISTTPNGNPVQYCIRKGSRLYSIEFYLRQFSLFTCNLQPGNVYYLNVKHDLTTAPASSTKRELNKN